MFSLFPVSSAVYACPAKLNLFLAVTGRRPDGFHDLVSVVAPLEFGDTLTVERAEKFSLTCDDPAVPVDETNLILKAARAFRAASGWRGGAKFTLKKRIPMGAGLGGGSSDAASALKALNDLAGSVLSTEALAQVAAEIGSDCPLFLAGGPVVIRGRGERVEKVPEAVAKRLKGRPALVFKPAFSVSTPWAYAQMAARNPPKYRPAAEAETRLANYLYLIGAGAAGDEVAYNDLEREVFAKYIALPVMLRQLGRKFGLTARMSGSGSACFALLFPDTPATAVAPVVREAWGPSTFILETRLA